MNQINDYLEQVAKAERRFHSASATKSRAKRQTALADLESGKLTRISSLDTPQRIRRRLQAYVGGPILMRDDEGDRTLPEYVDEQELLQEALFGESQLSSFSSLLQIIAYSRSVCRIRVQIGAAKIRNGTGFMVSPRLLLTNQHVLKTAEDAASSSVEFDYYERPDQTTTERVLLKLSPETFFVNNKSLDYALVAVNNDEASRFLKLAGFIPMQPESGKAIVGDHVNIIQHPGGRPKQIAFRENRVIDRVREFLHYQTDTQKGSSGSPVISDSAELAALHHATVPKRNEDKKIVLKDGSLWDGSRDTIDQWEVIGNEGTRISEIVKDVRSLELSGRKASLLDECFEADVPPAEDVLAELSRRDALESIANTSPSSTSTALQSDGGDIHVTVNVHLPNQVRNR